MKHLETLLYLNPNKIENSLFNTFLAKEFKIYSYDNIDELSEYIISDLDCDLILVSEDILSLEKFENFFEGRHNLVVMSESEHISIKTLKLPIMGLELKEKLIEIYNKLK